MEYLKKVCRHFLDHGSLYFFVFLIFFSFDRQGRLAVSYNADFGPFAVSDVAEYYDYLPTFFYGNSEDLERVFKQNKRTVGMAAMYLPAFLVGKLRAHDSCGGGTKVAGMQPKGFSKPYHRPIRWESIIVTILGLFFCRLSLRLYFKDFVVLIALICTFFGTNLFYYTFCNGEMPHSYLFFLYSMFVFLSLKLILRGRTANLLLLGLIGGMITLIRPTDVLILLFPILFGVGSVADLKIRMKTFVRRPLHFVFAVLLFLLPIAIQMYFWKQYTGHFVVYTYSEEGFFFNDPQIMNFLFSFRKGWLVYTPIMVFSLIGIVLSRKHLKDFFAFLVVFTIANIYVLSSWWDWSYGGSFGCRPLIQSYAVLIFPFAAFVSWCWGRFNYQWFAKAVVRGLLVTVLFLLVGLNLFQNWQYRWQVIHWSGMNAQIYKYIFLKTDTKEEDLNYIHSIATPPDTEEMLKGNRD